jgi:Tat protein secretion system quality control protein TatD with DNase activity
LSSPWEDNCSPTPLFRLLFHDRRRGIWLRHIRQIAKSVPDHLLLTETDNPGALKWLKKNDEIGMPAVIKEVVNAVELFSDSPIF